MTSTEFSNALRLLRHNPIAWSRSMTAFAWTQRLIKRVPVGGSKSRTPATIARWHMYA